MPIVKRVPAFEDGHTFMIENVLVDYASVFRPNTTYRPEWAVVIRVPQAMIQEFYEVGFRLKQNPDGQVTLRAKRYVRLDNGEEMSPPEVVDCENNPWPESRGLIGNGSMCTVKVRAKYTSYQGVEGLSCFLEGLQIIEHVPYHGSGPSFQAVQGSTGGWSQQNFQAQPQQQPPAAADPNPFTQQPPAAFNPQAPAPPAPQPQPPIHPAAAQQAAAPAAFGIPQGPPAGGNVSQPPQGALQSPPQPQGFQQPAFQQPAETPEEDGGTEYKPPSMGDDVPF